MAAEQVLRFAPYRLDSSDERLWLGKEPIKLTPKSFAVLQYLVERSTRLVTKEELFSALWSDTAVGDASLTRCIREIRAALSDNSRAPVYIETTHRRGFRFIGRSADGLRQILHTETRYAKSDRFNISFQVLGNGPFDVVVVPGWVSNVEGWWDLPAAKAFYERLAAFCRLIIFDKRGTACRIHFLLTARLPLNSGWTTYER